MRYSTYEVDRCIESLLNVERLLSSTESQDAQGSIQNILKYLEFIKSTYQNIENGLKDYLSNYFDRVFVGAGSLKGKFVDKPKKGKSYYNKVNTYKHTSIRKGKSLTSYIKNGACIGGSATYSLFKNASAYVNGAMGVATSIKFLNASISGDVGVSLYDENGKLYPNVYAEVGARLSILESTVNASIGNSQLGLTSGVDVEVGSVYAEAKAKVGANGVDISANVGAHIAKAGGNVGFHIFGYYIEAEVSAILGGVSAGFEYQHSNEELVVGVEGSLLGGLGIKFKFGKGD